MNEAHRQRSPEALTAVLRNVYTVLGSVLTLLVNKSRLGQLKGPMFYCVLGYP